MISCFKLNYSVYKVDKSIFILTNYNKKMLLKRTNASIIMRKSYV